jgi:hypothetical protein
MRVGRIAILLPDENIGLVIIRHKDSDQNRDEEYCHSKDEPYYTNVYEAAITRAINPISALDLDSELCGTLGRYYPFLLLFSRSLLARFCLAQQVPPTETLTTLVHLYQNSPKTVPETKAGEERAMVLKFDLPECCQNRYDS